MDRSRARQGHRGCVKRILITVISAAIAPALALCAWALPTRGEIIKKYADAAPARWGSDLPGIVRTLGTEESVLALTLDLCGGKLDRALVGFLIENEIPATFFVSSRWIKHHQDDLAMLASVPIFELAGHGLRHVPASLTGRAVYGITGTKGPGELYDEVMQNLDDIERVSGTCPNLFRSGTAYYDDAAVGMMRELGITPVGYSILGDAGATYSEKQVSSAVSKARSGDIIIAHANHPEGATGRGLMQALPVLSARGFRFVKLSEYISPDR